MESEFEKICQELYTDTLKEKYIDYIVDHMDLDTLIDYVRESLNDNYKSMTQTEFTEMVDADEGFFIKEQTNG